MQAIIRVGARGSRLSLWQAHHVADLLKRAWPGLAVEVTVISTTGDRVLDTPLPLLGGKGVFTQEIEAELRDGRIDLAVHSLKDLPVEDPDGLVIGGTPARAEPGDVLISRSGRGLADLPAGATVGTSSPRRAAQLRHARPDLQMASIRGNVDTRIAKALDPSGPFDAIVLARSGIERLEQAAVITEIIPLEIMLPAPGQGALAIQCRDDPQMHALLAPINHAETAAATIAERAFLQGLGGGCSAPVGAYGSFSGGTLHLHGRWLTPDGATRIDVRSTTNDGRDPATARDAGRELAEQALAQGAAVTA